MIILDFLIFFVFFRFYTFLDLLELLVKTFFLLKNPQRMKKIAKLLERTQFVALSLDRTGENDKKWDRIRRRK